MKLIRLWKLIKKMNLLEKQNNTSYMNKDAIEREKNITIRNIQIELNRIKRIKIIMYYSILKRRIVWKIRYKKKEIEV